MPTESKNRKRRWAKVEVEDDSHFYVTERLAEEVVKKGSDLFKIEVEGKLSQNQARKLRLKLNEKQNIATLQEKQLLKSLIATEEERRKKVSHTQD